MAAFDEKAPCRHAERHEPDDDAVSLSTCGTGAGGGDDADEEEDDVGLKLRPQTRYEMHLANAVRVRRAMLLTWVVLGIATCVATYFVMYNVETQQRQQAAEDRLDQATTTIRDHWRHLWTDMDLLAGAMMMTTTTSTTTTDFADRLVQSMTDTYQISSIVYAPVVRGAADDDFAGSPNNSTTNDGAFVRLPIQKLASSPNAPVSRDFDLLSMPAISAQLWQVLLDGEAQLGIVAPQNLTATFRAALSVSSAAASVLYMAYPVRDDNPANRAIGILVAFTAGISLDSTLDDVHVNVGFSCVSNKDLGKDALSAGAHQQVLLSSHINSKDSNAGVEDCLLLVDVQSADNEPHGSWPLVYTIVVGAIFVLALVFAATFEMVIGRQQHQLLIEAAQSNAIVSSLFPERVRERLICTEAARPCAIPPVSTRNSLSEAGELERSTSHHRDIKYRINAHLVNNTLETQDGGREMKPIADFFPHTTVMFADIAGFTAWSSQREPAQVFTLLQNVYQAFDKAARKRGVFKVETIGDSYVAVTGVPEKQDDHAVRMAGFAVECRTRMIEVTRRLERILGPETAELSMRFGLHSGPCTAGVLRGERSRFQLFGDTVNTAARMESTGKRDFIQVSSATAKLLEEAGKEHWVTPREEVISVKGKGDMKTFWLEWAQDDFHMRAKSNAAMSTASFGGSFAGSMRSHNSQKRIVVDDGSQVPVRALPKGTPSLMWGVSQDVLEMPVLKRHSSGTLDRLIDWNVDTLSRLLKQIVVKRMSASTMSIDFLSGSLDAVCEAWSGRAFLDEVAEIIKLPTFSIDAVGMSAKDYNAVELDEEVESQLREYVRMIAHLYRDNPFHNFEHACHVQMGMVKLLQRVVNPAAVRRDSEASVAAKEAHEFTYGIHSDPLTQFAVLFSALIHDVDHTGVTNGQLIKEKAHIASLYNGKSVAEQNSLDLAWELLMDPSYADLRRCIFTNESELKRFRQIVVNVVLATDIFDKELSALRKNRWEKAFSPGTLEESPHDAVNRKATIVLEHLIQASDVSHTMQHWDIYRKWNEKLFHEMYTAFKSGRTDADPSSGWYKGELWFFDNYVIPLAKKLKDCGVFGVCSDECLIYAQENRRRWEEEGESIVAEMIDDDYLGSLKRKKARRSRR